MNPDEAATDARRHRVFVYGTLRQGGSNHHRMEGAEFIAPATIKARLYRIDWYPGLISDPAACPVVGELYTVDDSQLAALDEYEGEEYRRVELPVTLTGDPDTTVLAWTWEWLGSVDESRRLPGGDWLA